MTKQEEVTLRKTTVLALVAGAILFAESGHGAELVRIVRMKISAADLASGIHAVEDYRKTTGVDAEYLDAVGWLARGAELLRRPELARQYVAELRREIPVEKDNLIVPFGAAIEVQGRLLAASEGRGAAIRYLESEYARAKHPALRSRIRKNINLLSLEGQPAPEIDTASLRSLRGKPVLVYFWMNGCGDCKAQSAALGRVWQKYRGTGLHLIAPTRLYGGTTEKPVTEDEERVQIDKGWKETYAPLDGVPVVISTETMVRYGVSATPTFALIDRKGIVRLYTPTRMSEAELSRRIDEVLAE